MKVLPGGFEGARAVLVMPTACVAEGLPPRVCSPRELLPKQAQTAEPVADSFAPYLDPLVRLKLEFAGFMLAEAAALRLTTAGSTTDAGPETVAELDNADARAVARALGLRGVVTSTLVLRSAGADWMRGELAVVLFDAETNEPRWTVRCDEGIDDVVVTAGRLANCVGNGILATFAPSSVVGKPL